MSEQSTKEESCLPVITTREIGAKWADIIVIVKIFILDDGALRG